MGEALPKYTFSQLPNWRMLSQGGHGKLLEQSGCLWDWKSILVCINRCIVAHATWCAVQVISAIENGQPLLMENLPEDIDAVLDPVIGKLTFRRGRNLILKVGDAEVEYDPNFR